MRFEITTFSTFLRCTCLCTLSRPFSLSFASSSSLHTKALTTTRTIVESIIPIAFRNATEIRLLTSKQSNVVTGRKSNGIAIPKANQAESTSRRWIPSTILILPLISDSWLHGSNISLYLGCTYRSTL